MLKVMILLERNGDLQVFMGIHKVFVEEVPGICSNIYPMCQVCHGPSRKEEFVIQIGRIMHLGLACN